MRARSGTVNLHVPEVLSELALLATAPPPAPDPAFPFVLSAGERRSFTANTHNRHLEGASPLSYILIDVRVRHAEGRHQRQEAWRQL
jgi:hypothetical protein